MCRPRFRAAALLGTLPLAACGLKDALTAHIDIAARAGSQELSVTRLAKLMASAHVPARKDVASSIAHLWVSYQLLGEAAARGDTTSDPATIDDAMWAQIAQARAKKFSDALRKTLAKPDSLAFEQKYNAGEMLAARHILFMAQANVMKQPERDSVRREAQRVARLVTPANFAQMAQKYSGDPGSRQNGGELGVFPKGQMVPEFEKGVLALKPGEVSGVVESNFGYHIIRRETWPEAKTKFAEAYGQKAQQSAESTFLATLEKNAKIEVRPGAARTAKAIAEDVDAYRADRTVLVTSRSGDLTAARFVRWIGVYPANARMREHIAQAPDSVVSSFLTSLMRNELVLHAADSAKAEPDTSELNGIRRSFSSSMVNTLSALHITPAQLADSARSRGERERLAAGRVESYVDALLQNKVQFVDVSEPVALALGRKYEARVVAAGIERAVSEAAKLIARADSAKAKELPPSVVPMPAPPAPKAAESKKADTGKAASGKKS